MKFILSVFILMCCVPSFAQHVGIGTPAPTQALSVNGTIVVDHDTTNYGSPQQASLWFGAHGRTVLSSNNNPYDAKFGSLNFWTNGQNRVSILQNGNVGIGYEQPTYKLHVAGTIYAAGQIHAGSFIRSYNNLYADNGAYIGSGPFNSIYKLQVKSGDSHFDGDGTFTGELQVNGTSSFSDNMTILGNVTTYGTNNFHGNIRAVNHDILADEHLAIGGGIDENYRLRVWDGNARIGGDLHATGRGAIGGDIDNNWRFRVYNGDSRFGGNVQVTGDLSTTGLTASTINGNGVVKSNGPSSLRVGFDSKNVSTNSIPAGNWVDVTANITDFSGSVSNVRVILSHLEPDAGETDFQFFSFSIHSVDSTTDTCKIRIMNESGAPRAYDGWIYLTTIAKD